MKSKVSQRGQTVVPAPLRQRYGIEPGTALEWTDRDGEIRVIPLPSDLIAALRGSARGERLTARLLRARTEERKRERRR